MESLYAKFIKETVDWNIIEDNNSFITYQIQKANKLKCIKVLELFVDKSCRGKNKWRDLMEKVEQIAKENECNMISEQISAKA